MADTHEVLAFIERHKLFEKGIGYVDVHLLAAGCADRGFVAPGRATSG